MQELEITGVWWLPHAPKDKVGGTLLFTPEKGITLKLIGALGNAQAVLDQTTIGTIFGVADKHLVTLEDCYTKRLHISAPGVTTHDLGAKRAYTGAHLDEADMLFHHIDIITNYLPDFISNSSLVGIAEMSKSRKQWKGLKAEVTSRKPIKIGPIPDGHISAAFGWSQSQEHFRSLTLTETCALRIELNTPYSMKDLLKTYVRPIQDLVTLATDRPNMITKLTVRNPAILDSHTKRPLAIDVYQRTTSTLEAISTKRLLRPDMLFTLRDLKRSKINRWITTAAHYRPAMAILFGQRYTKVNVENKLLNAVSSIEAYHRRKFKNTVLDKPKWKAKKKRLVNSVNESDKSYLNSVLQYANEKRLVVRLDEVVKHSGIGEDFIPDIPLWNKYVRQFRNALTHYDPAAPEEITDYEAAYWLAESLAWILLASLMIEAGFSRNETLNLIKNNQRYGFVKLRVKDTLTRLG